MRRASIFIILFASILFACNKQKQEAETATGVPGDNLDLYAVLDVFKSSKDLESFEKALNDKSNKINNLDLNVDGKVDYIKVIDHKDGDAHAITLRALVSKTESHDVAVIEIEKTGENSVNVQIIGDEAIYGKDVIIEPKSEKEKAGFATTTVAVNVWSWPVVTYMYSPAYVVYVSPYEYEYYPVWYDPWAPVAYDVYYPTVYHYHSYYYPVNELRFERAHAIYHERRVVSGYVQKHHYDNGRHNGWRKGNNPPSNNGVAPRGNSNDNQGRQDNYAPRGNNSPNASPRGNDNANPKGGDINRSNQRGNGSADPKGGDYNRSNQRGNQNSPNVNPRGNQSSPNVNQRGGNSNPKGGYDHSNQRGKQQSSPNVNPRGNQSSPNVSPRGNGNPKGGGYQQGSPAPKGNAAPRQPQGGQSGPKGNPRPR
jgi:hypothetical protein